VPRMSGDKALHGMGYGNRLQQAFAFVGEWPRQVRSSTTTGISRVVAA
jgi:hypothetical protein